MLPMPNAARWKIAASLTVNVVLPPLLYLALKSSGASDFLALSLASAIPPVWTLVVFAVRRRLDWIGVFATTGYLITLVAALLLGGNTLLLKTHSLLFTGPLGLLLLASALAGRPLLLVILPLVMPERFAEPGAAERLQASPAAARKIALATLVLGLALLLHAAIEVGLALALATPVFLVAKKVTTWAIIGGAIAILLALRGRPEPV